MTILENTETTRTPRVVTPKLTCIVTGRERLTNKTYLEAKAAAAGSTVENYLSNYISREALRLLRQGKSLDEIRKELAATATTPITDEALQVAIRLNGKWSKAAK
jgi:hypothetical protein